jgi:hypothetical protein
MIAACGRPRLRWGRAVRQNGRVTIEPGVIPPGRPWQSRLLWIDCIAAAIVGVLLLALSPWLARLFALPHSLVLVIGAANLAYGAYSFSLARRAHRPMALIVLLVCANAAWAVVCVALVVRYRGEASVFGMMQFIGEGAFVGGLALLEWQHRATLATAPRGSDV